MSSCLLQDDAVPVGVVEDRLDPLGVPGGRRARRRPAADSRLRRDDVDAPAPGVSLHQPGAGVRTGDGATRTVVSMSEQRSTAERTADVRAALARHRDAWLATASASGRPHLIAVSARWDGSQVTIATITTSRTARNLDATGLGRLALGSPDDVIMIDIMVSGSVPVGEAGEELAAGFAAAVGWSPAEEEGSWRFFRLLPVRIQAYRGYGDLPGREVMRDSRWLEEPGRPDAAPGPGCTSAGGAAGGSGAALRRARERRRCRRPGGAVRARRRAGLPARSGDGRARGHPFGVRADARRAAAPGAGGGTAHPAQRRPRPHLDASEGRGRRQGSGRAPSAGRNLAADSRSTGVLATRAVDTGGSLRMGAVAAPDAAATSRPGRLSH